MLEIKPLIKSSDLALSLAALDLALIMLEQYNAPQIRIRNLRSIYEHLQEILVESTAR